jgi:hypothetical protein
MGTKCDEDIGFWIVELDIRAGESHFAVIHIDCIIRTIHLMPVMRTTRFVDCSVTIHTSLNDFKLFYLNRFVNHHAFISL